MPEAAARVAQWRAAGEGDGALPEVRAALDDDLDTPGAVKALDAASEQGRGVTTAAALLGIDFNAA
jgi:L-cysteine:1D-myo-inositol 2-amino-2-deoxy-alpha-D-glucopyranoside ligase